MRSMNVAVCSAYFENSLIAPLADQFRESGAAIHLWALESTFPSVSTWTRGVGLLPKFTALNKLLPLCTDAELVLFVDDDVRLGPNFLPIYHRIVQALGAAVAQPALTSNSHYTY